MQASRTSLALDGGVLRLPADGTIAVLGARAEDDLSVLPRERLRLFQGFFPDHQALTRAGYRVAVTPEGRHAAVVVCLPRARAEAQAMVAQAAKLVAPGAQIVIDGQKTDGIDTMLRDCRSRVAVSEALSKAHGRIFFFSAPERDLFADWAAVAAPHRLPGGFETLPGVFSADRVDPGSALLAAALPEKLGRRVVDLGAGWGYLAAAALGRTGVERLHLVEAEAAALACAQRNITDPRAQFHWHDALHFQLPDAADTIVMNPPFHRGRAAEPDLGGAFIAAAARLLGPGGALWMVANRHLPYGAFLSEHFREVDEIGGDGRFRLTRAARPRPGGGRRR